VGKFHKFIYMAWSDRTANLPAKGSECYKAVGFAGGTLLISRHELARAGGW